jgi:predicted nucleic acid-binding protein
LIVPLSVARELQNRATPNDVRRFIENPPPWVLIRSASSIDPTIKLGPGENEAISLALEVRADRILIDDRAAHLAATQRGVHAVGTLAVLYEAAEAGLLKLPDAIAKLRTTNFRVAEPIIEQLLLLDAQRTNPPST